ncbi:hypothetical protein H0G86_010823 [Trichoderma simmonsii]|uniref:Uncharacterized protein n=1 Tax=Trichoderma simmonsii TaxID=1491479 RepID=A0A8G0PKF3_9HYPO|nr:hypothetical protein H0G86_010823 [Trichoderma simmonsii]
MVDRGKTGDGERRKEEEERERGSEPKERDRERATKRVSKGDRPVESVGQAQDSACKYKYSNLARSRRLQGTQQVSAGNSPLVVANETAQGRMRAGGQSRRYLKGLAMVSELPGS